MADCTLAPPPPPPEAIDPEDPIVPGAVDYACPKHRIRDAFYTAFEGFCGRKASMTLVAFGMILIVAFLGGRFPNINGNLPTILGAILGALAAFMGGHVIDAKWSPPVPPQSIAKGDLPGVAKAIAKDVIKAQKEDQEEGS